MRWTSKVRALEHPSHSDGRTEPAQDSTGKLESGSSKSCL